MHARIEGPFQWLPAAACFLGSLQPRWWCRWRPGILFRHKRTRSGTRSPTRPGGNRPLTALPPTAAATVIYLKFGCSDDRRFIEVDSDCRNESPSIHQGTVRVYRQLFLSLPRDLSALHHELHAL